MSKKTKFKKAKLVPPYVPAVIPGYDPKAPKKVMEINGVSIYGSSAYLSFRIPNVALRIDMSGLGLGSTHLVSGNTAAYAQLPTALFAQKVPILSIDWADGTAHSLDLAWWKTLMEAIEALPEGSSVVVCCVGGTGRTGTVLAILAGLSDQFETEMSDDPVRWVRSHYYENAVETEEQMWYIEDITGFEIFVEPSGFLLPIGTYPHGTQVLGIPDLPQSQAAVTGSLGGRASVGASDRTGS